MKKFCRKTSPRGTDLGGIDSLERLRDRCWINPVTGCWEWRWALDPGDKQPRVWIRDKRTVRGRRAALVLAGVDIPKGWIASSKEDCNCRVCVNPEHARAVPRHVAIELAVERGAFRSPGKRASMIDSAAGRRKLTTEQVLEIHRTRAHLPMSSFATRFGVALSTIDRIIRGVIYKELHPSFAPLARDPADDPPVPHARTDQDHCGLPVHKFVPAQSTRRPPRTTAARSVFDLGDAMGGGK